VDWFSSGSGKGPVAGCCEHGNEPSDSVKRGGGDLLAVRVTISFSKWTWTLIRDSFF